MTWRRQLTVASPISISALARAAGYATFPRGASADSAPRIIAGSFGAQAVVATDSGTSALILALRLTVPRGGIVGFPGYACVDLAAAALFAGVRVRIYDIDPATLSPDLGSVERLLGRGVNALVGAHLFGYPADIPGMRALASAAGVPLIEDAAQGAGGRLQGRMLGSLGDLSVLSFGRGKGLNAGGGGALLGFGPAWAAKVAEIQLHHGGRGWSGLAKTAVQFGLGRPWAYALPSMLPGLHLGEMVYHPASEPADMTVASGSLVQSALELSPGALAVRQDHAASLAVLASKSRTLGLSSAIPGSAPGYLRYPVRDLSGRRTPMPALGIVRPYPQTLAEQPQLAPILEAGEPAVPGATELRRALYTLPTHAFVTAADVARIGAWLAAAD